ncbi:DUF2399 domain-containing protein [Kibdelosporangium philippinense]|uniref:DUF2399 domain-containing protein n=1 Tax=Kibdelosporangium philippinense TaxID=211113 RepID=A0ABS8ZXD7_9PSEU|nr:DUF2399 domain-containing protein [Kibdelosporangium philippinense]MCE7011815.1 DUF2399 domain-containing protein [Kibdelosporangium philippinense]
MIDTDATDPDVKPLWEAVASRLANGADPTSIRVVKAELSRTGRALITGWLVQNEPASRRRRQLAIVDGKTVIPLPRVLEALGLVAEDLPAVVPQLAGPFPDLAGERLRAARLRNDLWNHAEIVLSDAPRLLARLRAAGVKDDKADDLRSLINALARARALLPLARPVPLARLALACAGNPHFFDLTEDCHGAKLVLLAVELLDAPQPDTPAAARATLARVGVFADRLSQTVLTLNVDAVGDGPVDRALRLARVDRRPLHLTLYDLTCSPPTLAAGQPWLVVENQSVVDEALIRHTTEPIVCTAGSLSAVDHVVLALANDAGIPIRYAGDLDESGHAIAESVRSRYGGQIVHMDEQTARAAEAAGPLANQPPTVPVLDGPSRVRLRGPRPQPIDPNTNAHTDHDGYVVFQEHSVVLDRLVGTDPTDPLRLPLPAPRPYRSPDAQK